MPKGKIEFDLSEPDEANKFKRMLKADDCYSALWEIQEFLRQKAKYADCKNINALEMLEMIRTHFYECIEPLQMDELYQ